ncbi:hypothetical protein [uncultured Gimesia sp.]|jgi:hypothetical protein|uniref:hypothetical protein n=1 Tax=uncultured Gimesia sp. TaxID=1678688 RepID=UPI0026249C5F|nr:hypothetical protein [uncultured Gimesia sp.]
MVFASESITDFGNLLTLFGIAIALSAYLSAIRLVAFQKIQEVKGEDQAAANKKWDLYKKLGLLTLADFPMVLSAFFLGLYLLWDFLNLDQMWNMFSNKDPRPWLQSQALMLFLIAGTVMVFLHLLAWLKTAEKLLIGKIIIEPQAAPDKETVAVSVAAV